MHASFQGHRKRLQRMWRQMPFAGSSPFHHSRGRDSGFVLAFEVEWSSICGMDYSNPLCQDGRVVVEAKQVIKREFQTVILHWRIDKCQFVCFRDQCVLNAC